MAVERIKLAAAQIPVLDLKPSARLVKALDESPSIDPGEGLLFGVLAEHPADLLSTCDRRSLIALCKTAELSHVRAAVAGRVISRESVVRKLADTLTLAEVAAGLREVAPNDNFVRSAFSSHMVAHPEELKSALDSYVRDLTNELGTDFLYPLS